MNQLNRTSSIQTRGEGKKKSLIISSNEIATIISLSNLIKIQLILMKWSSGGSLKGISKSLKPASSG